MKRRPINLDLRTIHFPVTAWVSVLHRASGAFVFLVIPVILWMLQESLASEQRYITLFERLQHPLIKVMLWIFLSALLYHSIAGVRHILMDFHIGESKKEARAGAWVVLTLVGISFLILGYWLW